MKHFTKKLSFFILLSLSLLSTSISSVPVTANAAAVRLSASSKSVTEGKTIKLRLINNKKKVKWKSANTYVATVNKNGTVKAKHKGNTTITAKVAKKTYSCKITVTRKSSKKGYTVYITDTGSKYHRSGCRYLWNSSKPIKKSQAISYGYDACSVCKP